MRLLDILEEVQKLNAEVIEEASKQDVRKAGNAKRNRALKIGNKLKARKGNINWTDDIIETRNYVVSAFMGNDFRTITKELAKGTDRKWQIIEVITALVTAHGGEQKLLATASKAGKKPFMTKVLDAVKEAEAELEGEE